MPLDSEVVARASGFRHSSRLQTGRLVRLWAQTGAAALLLACGDASVGLPGISEATKTLIVGAKSDTTWTYAAIDTRDEHWTFRGLAEELLVGEYAESLEDLAMKSGVFSLSDALSCLLLRPIQVYGGTPQSGLAEVKAERLTGALVPDPSRCDSCLTFGTVLVPYGPQGESVTVRAAAPLNQQEAFVATTDIGSYRVSRDRATSLDGCSEYSEAAAAPGGQIWVGRTSTVTTIERLAVNGTRCEVLERRVLANTRQQVEYIVAPPESPQEMYVSTDDQMEISRTGRLYSWNGDHFAILVEEELALGRQEGGLAWISPGRVAYSSGDTDVFMIRDGMVEQRLLGSAGSFLSAVGVWKDLETVVVGDNQGDTFILRDSTFQHFRSFPRSPIGTIRPYLGDSLVVSCDASLYILTPGEDGCPPSTVDAPSNHAPNAVFTTSDGWMFVGDLQEDGQPSAVWFQPQPR